MQDSQMERKQSKRSENYLFYSVRYFSIGESINWFVIFQINDIKKCFEDKANQQIEFQKLLNEEVRILNEIEKKRNKIRKQAHEKFMDEMLDKMGAPVKWIGYKSIIILEYS